MQKILAVDYGERRTGIAISDPENRIVLGMDTLIHDTLEQVAMNIVSILKKEKIQILVIGLPMTLRGTLGIRAQRSKELKKCIEQQWKNGIVEFEDERFTSTMADSWKIPGDKDQKAAILILQAYLDRNK